MGSSGGRNQDSEYRVGKCAQPLWRRFGMSHPGPLQFGPKDLLRPHYGSPDAEFIRSGQKLTRQTLTPQYQRKAGGKSMRRDISFRTTDGVLLRGWHFVPDGEGKHPTIVMAHGFSAVKEMYLDRYAERFAHAGIASVVYDHRNFGASEGQPRQELDPWVQIRDYSDGITFAQSLPETDGTRIGVWGSSYSGAHVIVVAAIDRRVKCVVSQVPMVSGWHNFRRLVRADFISGLEAMFHADRANRAAGNAAAMLPVVAEDPSSPAALPTADSFKWFTQCAASMAPNWRNEVTLRSIEYGFGYEPGAYIGLISPTPLLLIVPVGDHLTVSDLSIGSYERAREPKRLVLMKGGHFDAYVDGFDLSAGEAASWFTTHLSA